MEIITFTIASKIIQCLEINLSKETKYLYSEKYKIFVKEIRDDTSRWKDISYYWMEIIDILEISVLPEIATDSVQFLWNYQCRFFKENI